MSNLAQLSLVLIVIEKCSVSNRKITKMNYLTSVIFILAAMAMSRTIYSLPLVPENHQDNGGNNALMQIIGKQKSGEENAIPLNDAKIAVPTMELIKALEAQMDETMPDARGTNFFNFTAYIAGAPTTAAALTFIPLITVLLSG